jgi:2-octaprenyl-6-methoxyphenol hydroxylase
MGIDVPDNNDTQETGRRITTARKTCDIAIVGGGLAGASLACALEPLGFSVAVIERVAFRAAQQPSYDDRTLALNDCSCRILEALGLWPALAHQATAIREIIVTEPGRPGRVVLSAAGMGLGAFGHVVEARSFGAAVLEQLAALKGVDVICPATVESVETTATRVGLRVSAGQDEMTVEARLVVAADGAASTVRGLLEIPVETHDYGQTAIICNITPEHHHANRAFEQLTPTGPFAVLPHVGERCGLVWCVATADARALLDAPESEFMAAAQHRFGNELGAFCRMGERSSYPLKLTRALRDTGERVVILGNAAHAIHPVGAQGFNLALRDVATLAEVLAGQGDPGEPDLLKRYSDWRRPDQESTVAWSDGMARLFANEATVAAMLRSAGFFAHALLPPLRRKLASGFMGYRGRVPRLALGERLPGMKVVHHE